MTQKKQIVILVLLLVIAGNIWYWSFFREKTAAPAGAVSVAENYQLLSVENPQLHKDRLESARRTEYKSNGRNIFSSIPPPPPEPPHPIKPEQQGPKQDPPPPIPRVSPLPVKFFGYGTVPNGTARRAFFTDGEDVYIVSEGEVLLNRFRIIKVGNASLDYEEVSSGLRGTANLEEQGATPSA
jgi:hypothetical protein